MNQTQVKVLEEKANEMRLIALEMIATLGVGHIGGSMSIIEILAVLYHYAMHTDPTRPKWEERDRLVLSKGHAGPALYAALVQKGFLQRDVIPTLNKPGTTLPSHCDMNITRGVDMTTGSLGQGFSAAVGMALGLRLKQSESRVYAIIGDGECQEGLIWEAAMYAGSQRLTNLTAILDYNKLQSDGTVASVNGIEPIADKWRAFGWNVVPTPGHDIGAIADALNRARGEKAKPSILLCETVKGKGALGFENMVTAHNAQISQEDWRKIKTSLSCTQGGAV